MAGISLRLRTGATAPRMEHFMRVSITMPGVSALKKLLCPL
jgi:hypothetical protein